MVLIMDYSLEPELCKLDQMRADDSRNRKVRGNVGISFSWGYILSTLIFWASKDKMLELEARLTIFAKSLDDHVINVEARECDKIITKYYVSMEYRTVYINQASRIFLR